MKLLFLKSTGFCFGLLLLATASQSMAEGTNRTMLDRLKEEFDTARVRFEGNTNNVEAGWQFARVCFDLADLATNNTQRAEFANRGIAPCRIVLAQNTNCAPAHYYLGMNLGELADTKHNFSGLRITKEMEREFLLARALDEHFDYAGPDRNLGLLYDQAPSVISVGSKSKARQHLEKAVELAPGFPENYLNLIEARLKWGDRVEALQELKKLESLWPDAQAKFTGPQWTSTWVGWNKRLKISKTKLEDGSK